jgi:hypothetical protein
MQAPRRSAAPPQVVPAGAPAVVQRATAAPKAAAELDAIFAEEEAPLELEEVVAVGTDPLRAQAAAPVALLGNDDPFGPDPFRRAPAADATVALFGEPRDLSDPGHGSLRGEDSAGDLDDLFADLVKE